MDLYDSYSWLLPKETRWGVPIKASAGTLFLYAENIEPPTALIVSKKDGSVVWGGYTSKPFEDEEVRLYLQVKTQGNITDPKQLKVAPKTIFVSECEKSSKRRIYQ